MSQSAPTSNDSAHEEEALGKAYDARLMRRLLAYLQPYKTRVALAVLVLLAASAIELLLPWVVSRAIDRVFEQRDLTLLTILVAVFAAGSLLGFFLEYAQTMLTTWLGQRVMFDLRRQIFTHLQRLDLRFYDRNPVGRLMTRVTSDVEVLNELFSSGVVTLFGDVFTLVLIALMMFTMDWRLTLVTLSVLPLVVLAVGLFRKRIRDAFRVIRTRLARINAFLQEHFSGVSVVQLFGRESDTIARFKQIDGDYLEAQLRSVTYYALLFPIIDLMTALACALIIAYGIVQIGGAQVTIGTIAAFILYARRFFRPIQDVADKYNMLQGAMASSERIFKLLDTPVEIVQRGTAQLPERGRGEIEFRDVWFAYQTRAGRFEATDADPWNWVIKGLSFKVRRGERIAIVGHTGSGKSTIISLLMRFYEPQRGQILFDGIPINEVDPIALRERIGLVLQDVFLFSRSVEYNIRLGTDRITPPEIEAAAQRVGAAPFIAQLENEYATALGERGTSLSVGERQLLSFARALAFDPLVLVLDEATSSVDSALEERIDQAISTLMLGRTSLVIAHRLSTVQNADRILVMHHGELREQGRHDELLRAGGLYARLYELQFASARAEGA